MLITVETNTKIHKVKIFPKLFLGALRRICIDPKALCTNVYSTSKPHLQPQEVFHYKIRLSEGYIKSYLGSSEGKDSKLSNKNISMSSLATQGQQPTSIRNSKKRHLWWLILLTWQVLGPNRTLGKAIREFLNWVRNEVEKSTLNSDTNISGLNKKEEASQNKHFLAGYNGPSCCLAFPALMNCIFKLWASVR